MTKKKNNNTFETVLWVAGLSGVFSLLFSKLLTMRLTWDIHEGYFDSDAALLSALYAAGLGVIITLVIRYFSK